MKSDHHTDLVIIERLYNEWYIESIDKLKTRFVKEVR